MAVKRTVTPVSYTHLSRIERERFSREVEAPSSEDALLSCDLLILDDLGTEFLTPFVLSVLNNIVNSRIPVSYTHLLWC